MVFVVFVVFVVIVVIVVFAHCCPLVLVSARWPERVVATPQCHLFGKTTPTGTSGPLWEPCVLHRSKGIGKCWG